jgi:hypothetical protein
MEPFQGLRRGAREGEAPAEPRLAERLALTNIESLATQQLIMPLSRNGVPVDSEKENATVSQVTTRSRGYFNFDFASRSPKSIPADGATAPGETQAQ